MFTILSLVTSVKDYIEIAHKLIETDPVSNMSSYNDFGAMLTYLVIGGKRILFDLFSFSWFQDIWSLPILVPNIAWSMISEISVLDGYFHNAQTFLETPLSYGNANIFWYCLEKFTIGLINSIFLCLPTSTAHLICLRRFVMQGLEAGYIAGLGTIAGNILWIGSIIFGFRFVVIPWLSFDILRYFLGFMLLIKYMWDSYNEKRFVLDNVSKSKIFLLNFLLAFTEQTNLYPFISNLSIGSDSTVLESFPSNNLLEFFVIHGFYLLGIIAGSYSLLNFTCWFWENPAFNIYMWLISSFKVTTNVYYKFVNFTFLYLTMICAMSSVTYFGLDYTLTNPIGFVHEDRLLDQKSILETAFLNTKASDRNTRRNRGRHGRRERWKRRIRRYRTFDASLYEGGIYDLFTMEDLNYGFDRFWLRRKMRNHGVRFRFFPGPWMRSFKKQLSKPRLESFMGPRVEFFRILFEQVYHPEFHEYRSTQKFDKKISIFKDQKESNSKLIHDNLHPLILTTTLNSFSLYSDKTTRLTKNGLVKEYSALRKFLRKVDSRIKTAQILNEIETNSVNAKQSTQAIYSKRWKQIFSKLSHQLEIKNSSSQKTLWKRLENEILVQQKNQNESFNKFFENNTGLSQQILKEQENSIEKNKSIIRLSKKDRQVLRYKTFLETFHGINQNNLNQTHYSNQQKLGINQPVLPPLQNLTENVSNSNGLNIETLSSKISPTTKQNNINSFNNTFLTPSDNLIEKNKDASLYKSLTLLHPLKFYLQKEQAFQRKLKFYGVKVFRNFSVENNAPYFRVMMKRFFYHYKPTLRWERTMRTATLRKARRKGPRIPRKLNIQNSFSSDRTDKSTKLIANINLQNKDQFSDLDTNFNNQMQKPTHFYSLVSKRANRYRYQIYKDVMQHWYYSPFNRLLLKFDIDGFIHRQPSAHFLTKKEEHLLHLRRFLLAEHYNTLRWYTQMQHYRSMKTKIGGTKSFASRIYNQQFQGTFKKIRHLFAVTPSATENIILKFDQPLYNEFPNKKSTTVLADSLIHEELLADDISYEVTTINADDLLNQSAKIIREYLNQTNPIRQQLILQLLQEKNYWELTSFLFKGQKTRGITPVTNKSLLIEQETKYFGNLIQNQSFLIGVTPNDNKDLSLLQSNSPNLLLDKMENLPEDLWISLIKKCQNQLYNQESLKIYLSRRMERRQKQKQKQQQLLKLRLERMKKWLIYEKPNTSQTVLPFSNSNSSKSALEQSFNSSIKTAVQKAIKEAICVQKGVSLEKTNLRNNQPLIKLPILKLSTSNIYPNNVHKIENLKDHLANRMKIRTLQNVLIENDLKNSFQNFEKELIKNKNFKDQSFSKNYQKIIKLFKTIFVPLHQLSTLTFEKIKHTPIKYIQNKMKPGAQQLASALRPTLQNDLKLWRHREIILSKRKKMRKKFDRLTNTKTKEQKIIPIEDLNFYNSKILPDKQPNRQKSENKLNSRNIKSWLNYKDVLRTTQQETSAQNQVLEKFSNIFQREFKRKRSRARLKVASKRRERIKKRTLVDKLRRQFRLLKKYGQKTERADKKVEIFQLITKRQYEPNSLFQPRVLKQQRTRQRKHRFWKKAKKQKYAQNRRKQRKRRRYAVGKVRNLNKKLKRIKDRLRIKQWWWQTFLPNFKAKTDAALQIQKDQQIQKQIANISVSELLSFDEKLNESRFEKIPGENKLQIGNTEYKPLLMPEALRIRDNLMQKEELSFGEKSDKNSVIQNLESKISTYEPNLVEKSLSKKNSGELSTTSENKSMIDILSQNLLLSNNQQIELQNSNKFMVGTNPIPFYAGWDETLRKFVITNRLLSRKDASYQMNFDGINSKPLNNLSNENQISRNEDILNNYPTLKPLLNKMDNLNFEFSNAPLKGMNAATTLYWQIPFTTYDPDQFFALGMDGFSPVNWKRFNFKHSKQTTKPILVKMKTLATKDFLSTNSIKKNNLNNNEFSYHMQTRLIGPPITKQEFTDKNFSHLNKIRRIQKRYKRVKKHPRPPVWFPSGPLTNQILPVHYIYVFYKRSRLPRDRYLSRRLRRNNDSIPNSIKESFTKLTDFTLRKRIKPKRKYHRKRIFRKTESLLLKRRAFRGFLIDKIRQRPLSKAQLLSKTDLTNMQLKPKQRRNSKNTKQQNENLRIRQLRRRIQRQVLRPIWRYKPRAGGFIWPGDYLRLELVDAPKLNQIQNKLVDSSNDINNINSKRKIRKKKRKRIQEWQIQPKKYLLQKHNLKVLKKRLEKAQNSHKIPQKVKELTYLFVK